MCRSTREWCSVVRHTIVLAIANPMTSDTSLASVFLTINQHHCSAGESAITCAKRCGGSGKAVGIPVVVITQLSGGSSHASRCEPTTKPEREKSTRGLHDGVVLNAERRNWRSAKETAKRRGITGLDAECTVAKPHTEVVPAGHQMAVGAPKMAVDFGLDDDEDGGERK